MSTLQLLLVVSPHLSDVAQRDLFCSILAWNDSINALSLLVATDRLALVTIIGTGAFCFEPILQLLFELINSSHFVLLVYDKHHVGVTNNYAGK